MRTGSAPFAYPGAFGLFLRVFQPSLRICRPLQRAPMTRTLRHASPGAITGTDVSVATSPGLSEARGVLRVRDLLSFALSGLPGQRLDRVRQGFLQRPAFGVDRQRDRSLEQADSFSGEGPRCVDLAR